MKIGIITIHNSTNYGACLQSWALYKFLIDYGYDCEIIDLHRPVHQDYIYSKKYVDYNGACKKAQRFNLKSFIKKYVLRKKIPSYKIERMRKFERFNFQIKLSAAYRSIDELYSNPPSYDIYITGSDQLWNPTQPFCIEPYFLTFVKSPSAKKISYAASIGHDTLSEKEKEDFKHWLLSYNHISVREYEAKQLLESLVSKPISQVSDPTFLLGPEYWRSIAKAPNEKVPYILCFKLYSGCQLADYVIKIGKELNKKVIVLTTTGDNIKSCQIVRNAGVEEFLGYIAHADMLISDSFHANVFGLLLGVKNLWAYISPDNHRGSRLRSLFLTFGIHNHFIAPDFSTEAKTLKSDLINNDEIYKIALSEQKKSSDFLLNAIRNKN